MSVVWPPALGSDSNPGWQSLAPMPFPVGVPFRMRTDLARLAPGEPLLISDAGYPAFAQAKLAHLDDDRRPLARLADDADPQWVIGALQAALSRLSHHHPELIGFGGVPAVGGAASPAPGRTSPVDGQLPPAVFELHRAALSLDLRDGVRVDASLPCAEPVAARLQRLAPALRLLATVSLALQEDLVLMAWPPGEPAARPAGSPAHGLLAQAMSVVFPSGWDPAAKLGQPLMAIHQPVADGGPLRDASLNLSRAMVEKGPFERFVWTLSADADLARWPDALAPARPDDLDPERLFFRIERQVTLGLPDWRAALFLIRVRVAPLGEVACDGPRRARLLAALESMSDATLAYKNLHRLRDSVRAAWG